MSHPFGDLLSQYLHRKHGLSQSKLAEGVLQDPSIIGKMCKGQRLNGSMARVRVCEIIGWLHGQSVLSSTNEANQLLAAAGMSPLNENESSERELLKQLTPNSTVSLKIDKPTRRTNLPTPLTSFVARQKELAEICELASTHRMVTLIGVGGVGKTRLAIEVAKHLLTRSTFIKDKFPNGVWFVELAALTPSIESTVPGTTLVARTIAQAFKQSEQVTQTPLSSIQEYLADKHLLLVIDNCEHLIETCAEVFDYLLQRCWGLHILATSREELRIAGEVTYSVQPLELPTLSSNASHQVLTSAAAQLFVERMSTVQPVHKFRGKEIADLAHICRQLDGIPLALELAAPLTRNLSLEAITIQLDNQMELLTSSYRATIPRHQTMNHALLWSYQLLTIEEQQLLARSSVFSGGWTLAAAKAVCTTVGSLTLENSDIASLFNNLIAKSLVLLENQHQERRYRLLEPVRQFAHIKLKENGEQEEIERNHAHYFLSLAEKMAKTRDTPQERVWLQILESERYNIRAVNQWAFKHVEIVFAQRFNGFLCAFWIYSSSVFEASQWLEGALALKNVVGKDNQIALRAKASTLNAAGYVAGLLHDFARARDLFEQELQLRIELGDQKGGATALRGICHILTNSNKNLEEAQPYAEQALTICREAQDTWGIAWSIFDLGYLAMVRGNLGEAKKLLAEALAMLQQQVINFGVFRALLALGRIMRLEERYDEAIRFHKEALHLQQEMQYLLHVAEALEGMAAIAVYTNSPVFSVRLLGAAYAHRQANAMLRQLPHVADYERTLELTHSQLDPDSWDVAWSEGCEMTLGQAVEYALSI